MKRLTFAARTMLHAIEFLTTLTNVYRDIVLAEGATHFETLAPILLATGVNGAKVHDARIAAICRDHAFRNT